MFYEFEITFDLSSNTIDFLKEKINQETPSFSKVSGFAILLKDKEGSIKAGCNCFIIFGCLLIDQIWVSPEIRIMGIGKTIIDKTHKIAKDHGCKVSILFTMDFQNTLTFYQKLGYQVDYKKEGLLNDSSMIYLSCKL
jgi:GNAT superfamily N-acetyltransferase